MATSGASASAPARYGSVSRVRPRRKTTRSAAAASSAFESLTSVAALSAQPASARRSCVSCGESRSAAASRDEQRRERLAVVVQPDVDLPLPVRPGVMSCDQADEERPRRPERGGEQPEPAAPRRVPAEIRDRDDGCRDGRAARARSRSPTRRACSGRSRARGTPPSAAPRGAASRRRRRRSGSSSARRRRRRSRTRRARRRRATARRSARRRQSTTIATAAASAKSDVEGEHEPRHPAPGGHELPGRGVEAGRVPVRPPSRFERTNAGIPGRLDPSSAKAASGIATRIAASSPSGPHQRIAERR